MLVNLACCSHKIPDGNNFWKKGSFQFTMGTVHHDREVMWQGLEAAGHIAPSQEADSDERWYSAHFFLCIQSGTQAHGMVLTHV